MFNIPVGSSDSPRPGTKNLVSSSSIVGHKPWLEPVTRVIVGVIFDMVKVAPKPHQNGFSVKTLAGAITARPTRKSLAEDFH